MVRLPLRDQHWILQQLTPVELKTFHCHKGNLALKQARKFKRDAPFLTEEKTPKPQSIPLWYSELSARPPLFQAIILNEHSFSWAPERQIDLPKTQIMQIKPKTRVALFNHWQGQLDFNAHMEEFSG